MKEKEAIINYLKRRGLFSFAPKAALIDMDGTLYDSMPRHAEAWFRMMSEVGINCTREEFYLYEGRTGASTINLLFEREFGRKATEEECVRLYKKKTEYFNQMSKAPVMPGSKKMVDEFLSRDITTVLVTGSGQHSLLDRLANDFPGAFGEGRCVTSRDVTHGKPHPEPFLKGMELAGVLPENAIAVDNAPMGVISAAASGAFTVGVTTGPVASGASANAKSDRVLTAQDLWDAGADIVYDSMPEFAERLPLLLDVFKTLI